MPLAVIPARYASVRFPGKPLALISGKPMVQHVVERCLEAKTFDRVVVATDDERIAAVVRGFGGEVAMTSPACASGTDRVAEVARALGLGADEVVVNVQGDEPALHPQALWALGRAFEDASVGMATLVRPLRDDERANPNVVKAVLDEAGRALYFSRADLPFQRDAGAAIARWGHVGIYGYRASTLARLATLPPTALEQTEALEQLRALGHGIALTCVKTTHGSAAVDRPEDVPHAEAALLGLPKTYPP
ncbi:MAG: 3-deoxy-manno-octulosonate cytidylyltransferase [Myxococcus sp.]|nr:3-deoxy-manno-octulosonate cytidylyltransferase [Myxococcus sp.]